MREEGIHLYKDVTQLGKTTLSRIKFLQVLKLGRVNIGNKILL